MKRREVLALCGSGLCSGCLGLPGPPRKTIPWILLENNRADPRDVELILERNDSEVFREQYRLGTTSGRSTVRETALPDERGRYSLSVDIGDQVVHLHPSELAEAESSEPCVGIRVTLHQQGTTGFEFEPTDEW